MNIKCRNCGDSYVMIPNDQYGETPQAMKYINIDEFGRYFSNTRHYIRPGCMTGKKLLSRPDVLIND